MYLKTWLKNTWEFIRYWEILKETIFQKFFTYHLPSTSSLLESKDLSGVSVIVTGSTSGVGLNTAKQLAMAGAHVIMACRNVNAANKIASMWREEAYNSRMPNVEVMELDLVSISSVRKFADEWERRGEPLDILINNAGILKIEDAQRFTSDGIEEHMQVNHVAPALLTLLLLPSLLKAPSPRIINVSSVIMFLKVLASKLFDQRQTSISCFAVHPGAVTTNLNAGARMNLVFAFDGTEGARSVILCATSDSVTKNLVKGFAYYSCTCEPGKLSPKAEDKDSCFEIWRKTLDILDMKNDYLARLLENQSN